MKNVGFSYFVTLIVYNKEVQLSSHCRESIQAKIRDSFDHVENRKVEDNLSYSDNDIRVQNSQKRKKAVE